METEETAPEEETDLYTEYKKLTKQLEFLQVQEDYIKASPSLRMRALGCASTGHQRAPLLLASPRPSFAVVLLRATH